MFHFIASTGRTATTFLASALDALPGVVACHEGYQAAEKSADPLLPLINLENAAAFRDPASAAAVVAQKRSAAIIDGALAKGAAKALIDVAYYNPMFAAALLEEHPQGRLVAIVREAESFVRSATCMSGEDLLPVGWPDPQKPLTARERFIGMGRIKPCKGTEAAEHWGQWSAIARNIWLWEATNRRLLEAALAAPERSLVLDFEALRASEAAFFGAICAHLGLPSPDLADEILAGSQTKRNEKPSGYQVPPAHDWTDSERQLLNAAVESIGALKAKCQN